LAAPDDDHASTSEAAVVRLLGGKRNGVIVAEGRERLWYPAERRHANGDDNRIRDGARPPRRRDAEATIGLMHPCDRVGVVISDELGAEPVGVGEEVGKRWWVPQFSNGGGRPRPRRPAISWRRERAFLPR
jgi:hypothetical protein